MEDLNFLLSRKKKLHEIFNEYFGDGFVDESPPFELTVSLSSLFTYSDMDALNKIINKSGSPKNEPDKLALEIVKIAAAKIAEELWLSIAELND